MIFWATHETQLHQCVMQCGVLSRGGAVPIPTPDSGLLIDSHTGFDSDSGSDSASPLPDQTIKR